MEEENTLILNNFLKMMKNRNIDLDKEYKNKKMKKEQVDEFFSVNIRTIDKDKKTYVTFIGKKVGVKDVKLKILDFLEEKTYDILIIISKYKLNSYVMNKLNNLNKEIQIFSYNNFYMNLIEHFLVPKHQILDKKYEKLIKEKFNNKLPLIKKKDPICKYYNCKVGQVLKIYRKHEIYYRLVSDISK